MISLGAQQEQLKWPVTVDIVIPVLNEEASLESNVKRLVKFLDDSADVKMFHWKIFIADNGSTDSTSSIAKRIETKTSGKVCYRKVDRRGVGLALKEVWLKSDADFVGYMDLDLATDLVHLPEALNALVYKNMDVVYGTRLHKNSIVIGRTLKREIVSRVFNTVLKNYLKVGFSDGMCGFKFFRAKSIPVLVKNGAVSDGWFFCTEVLVVAEWLRLRVYELPVQWTDDSKSKVKLLRLMIEYLKAMNVLKKRRSIKK